MEVQDVIIHEVSKSELRGIDLRYGVAETELGALLIGVIDEHICWLGFYGGKQDPEDLMKNRFSDANFVRDDMFAQSLGEKVLCAWKGQGEISLLLCGTPFQCDIWRVLLSIPYGEVVNYQDIAEAAGKPKAVRAVGTAIGKNPISLLVPCHRVLPRSGGVGNYLWGSACKQRLIGFEDVA